MLGWKEGRKFVRMEGRKEVCKEGSLYGRKFVRKEGRKEVCKEERKEVCKEGCL